MYTRWGILDKKEFQKIVKEKMKDKGFRSRGNHCYKIVDDKYLIGISLIHQSIGQGYFIDYGIVYLPDETKMPFKGDYDWSRKFWFTKDYDKELSRYQLDNVEKCCQELVDYFDYNARSRESADELIDINIEKMLSVLSDPNCAFIDYQSNLDLFASLSEHEIKKFIKLGALSKQTVLQHRIQRGYKNNSFLDEVE